ncbi:hypothetical protein [uncultured Thiodictyon sp.]|jgi:hypothetical protein|uniref:hypothetical protein n=1 Tax=uncultured Thiodictyon sp. TaxID=1846217 RepID=UPI0025DAA803|nr:hypothetical protein [uncultured Thiodictyon sp.]
MSTFAVTESRGLVDALAGAAAGDRISLAAGNYWLDTPLDLDRALILAGAGLGQTCIEGECGPFLLRYVGEGRLVLLGIHFRHTAAVPANVVGV